MSTNNNKLGNLVAWIFGMFVMLFITFRVMGVMQVKDDAQIILSKYACPLNVMREANGSCVVTGSLSRNFIFGEVEITLADKSMLLVRQQDVLGYSAPTDSTRYEPFGKYGALLIGLLIIGIGFSIAVVLPAWAGRDRSSQ